MSLSTISSATDVSARPRFHALRVAEVRRETPDAVSVAFEVPPALTEPFRFEAGQYLTLRRHFDGEEVRRSYSIVSMPDEGELRIGVRLVEGGRFSGWLHQELTAGTTVEVMTPTGRFGRIGGEAPAVVAAFAAGSGITPILPILGSLLARHAGLRAFLVYGNRSSGTVMFRDRLDALKDRYLDRFALLHVLSREEQDLPLLHGRLDSERLRLLLRHAIAEPIDHAFVCGPEAMSEEVARTLAEAGVAEERIHVERFVSAHGGAPARPMARAAEGETPVAMASLTADGRRREVPVAAGETVLDAALRAGLDLPYACKGGMCSTCRARVLEGEVKMAVNFALEPWEVEQGFVLTCQARPVSGRVVVDYDQV